MKLQVLQSVCILEYMWGGGQRASEEGSGQAVTLQLPQGHALPHLHHCPVSILDGSLSLRNLLPWPWALEFWMFLSIFHFVLCQSRQVSQGRSRALV